MHQYPPHFIGGTELYTQTLARYQVLSGHQASVFCPFPNNEHDEIDYSEEQGVGVYRVPLEPRSRTQVFLDSFRQQNLKGALEEVLPVVKPDIVHIQHLMGMPISLIDSVVALEIPFVVTLHDYWYECANAQLLTNTEQAICSGPDRLFFNCARCALARSGRDDRLWMAPSIAPLMFYRNIRLNKVLDKAARIIAPTRFVHQIYSELGAPSSKMVVIKHGLELPAEKVAFARLVNNNREPAGLLRIGYIGGINWQKGLHILIEAVNGLPEGQVDLTIYGDQSAYRDYVTELNKNSKHSGISLPGPIPHEQIWSVLAGFDIVVLPTLWYETSSLILDEAFAVGVPVIASRIGVMVEKIEDGETGRLFPVGDVRALRDILMDLIENPDTLVHWQAGIPNVRLIDDHVKEIEDVYNHALVAL